GRNEATTSLGLPADEFVGRRGARNATGHVRIVLGAGRGTLFEAGRHDRLRAALCGNQPPGFRRAAPWRLRKRPNAGDRGVGPGTRPADIRQYGYRDDIDLRGARSARTGWAAPGPGRAILRYPT